MIFGTAIGRIAIEPRISEVNGTPHLYLLIYTRDAGKKFYVGASLWGERAKKIFQYLRIDQPVAISGKFQAATAHEDAKSGDTKTTMTMILTDIELLDATLDTEYTGRGTKAKKTTQKMTESRDFREWAFGEDSFGEKRSVVLANRWNRRHGDRLWIYDHNHLIDSANAMWNLYTEMHTSKYKSV